MGGTGLGFLAVLARSLLKWHSATGGALGLVVAF